MKYLVILGAILATAHTQRPSFAGSGPIGVPKLAARFGNAESSGAAGSQFPNRFGVGTNTYSSPSVIPIDNQWQQTWPRENQPFSVLNSEHIRKQLYPDGTRRTSLQDVATNDLGQGSGFSVRDRDFSGQNQFLQNRGSFDVGKDSQNTFSVFKDNQLVTYVYDSATDAWYPRRS